MEKTKNKKVIKTRTSTQKQSGSESSNQKKIHKKSVSERKSIFLTEYMKEIIKIMSWNPKTPYNGKYPT